MIQTVKNGDSYHVKERWTGKYLGAVTKKGSRWTTEDGSKFTTLTEAACYQAENHPSNEIAYHRLHLLYKQARIERT